MLKELSEKGENWQILVAVAMLDLTYFIPAYPAHSFIVTRSVSVRKKHLTNIWWGSPNNSTNWLSEFRKILE